MEQVTHGRREEKLAKIEDKKERKKKKGINHSEKREKNNEGKGQDEQKPGFNRHHIMGEL